MLRYLEKQLPVFGPVAFLHNHAGPRGHSLGAEDPRWNVSAALPANRNVYIRHFEPRALDSPPCLRK
jgi:hypothetical protein